MSERQNAWRNRQSAHQGEIELILWDKNICQTVPLLGVPGGKRIMAGGLCVPSSRKLEVPVSTRAPLRSN